MTWTAEEIANLRSETPGCRNRKHFNNAGAALMPETVVATVTDYLQLEAEVGGYEAANARASEIAAAYESVAALIGAADRNIAFVENATAAYAQALSAIPLGASDVIVTSRNDYISNQLMFLSLRQRFGVRFVRAQDLPEGGVDPDSVAKLIKRHSPKLVAITHVPTHSGLMQPIVQIGKTCKSFGVPYLVDACQSVGQLPLAVEEIGCDFLSATARKFLRGPRGVGFLYVSDLTLAAGLEPLFIDMRGADWIARDEYRSHDDATRFENWEFAYALLLGTGTAAAYARGVGLDRIGRRTSGLAASIRQHLRHLSGVKVLDHGQNLCGIVAATIAGVDANSCYRQLLERDINTALSFRRYSLIDFAEPGVDWAVRISPHYYNTESEIDELVAAIEEIAS